MANYKAIIQATDYIINNAAETDTLDKLSILKLLFFAERYSLQQFAQMITNDEFYAMNNGPVASATYDIISFKDTAREKEYLNQILSKDGNYCVKSNNALFLRDDYDELSDSDLEALDFAINNFGKFSPKELSRITHLYPEWQMHEAQLKTAKTAKINTLDFFSPSPKDSPFNISLEQINASKEIYKEALFDR